MFPLSLTILSKFVSSAAKVNHEARQGQINRSAIFSRLTMILYDILINKSREKHFMWDAPFRISTLVYYMARYPPIAYELFGVVYKPGVTPHCDAWDKFTWAISLVPTRLAIVVSFVLRVYVVTDKVLVFVVLLSLLGFLVIILDIWQDVQASCTATSNPISSALTYITLVIFDVLATVLISWRVIRVILENGGFKRTNGMNLYSLILRSGFMYYLVITIPQVGAIILYFLPQGLYSTAFNDYIIVLSSILVSQFLLDLRSMASKSMGGTAIYETDIYETPSLAFGLPSDAAQDNNSMFQSLMEDFGDSEMLPWANWGSNDPESTTNAGSIRYPLRELRRIEATD